MSVYLFICHVLCKNGPSHLHLMIRSAVSCLTHVKLLKNSIEPISLFSRSVAKSVKVSSFSSMKLTSISNVKNNVIHQLYTRNIEQSNKLKMVVKFKFNRPIFFHEISNFRVESDRKQNHRHEKEL